MTRTQQIQTPALDIACEIGGPAEAPAVVLLHGFPYDPRSFDAVVEILGAAGLRTIVPWLRGYGATRFRHPDTPRSGQQAAIGQDLLDLIDALHLQAPILAGFDWGARAACIAAALRPERVRGLVTCGGYQIQDIARAGEPVAPEQELRFWYQYYFQTARGRDGLAQGRADLCRLLWQLWSPTWPFDAAAYAGAAASFDNPDFVEVVIHSYRHRMGNAPGDPRHAELETRLAGLPRIAVPTISLHGDSDGVNPAQTSARHDKYFTARYERRVLPQVGHNPPMESPAAFAQAILDLNAGDAE